MQNLLQCYGAKKVSFLCYHGTPIQTLFLGLGHPFRQPGTRDELTQRTSLEEAIDGNQRLKSRQYIFFFIFVCRKCDHYPTRETLNNHISLLVTLSQGFFFS